MSKLRNFNKLDSSKKQSNKSSWIILSVSVLIVTIIIFSSYAKYLSTSKEVAITNSTTGDFYYREDLLNGTDPVLTDNLIPVTISDTGSVAKADLYNEWYKYEDKKWANAVKLFEKEVTTVKDSSGKGNDGTVYGNLVEGYGYASFDGTDDYIDTSLYPDFSTSFSVVVSFKYNNISDRHSILMNNSLDLYINENGGLSLSLAYLNSNSETSYVGIVLDNTYFVANKWYEVVYTFDETIMRCYLNGEHVADKSIGERDFITGNRSLKVGTNARADARFLNTRLSYVALYNSCLSENDAINYFDNSINNENLLFEYKFYDVYDEEMINILEDDIESYFVWIPKYSYQLFDLGNYNNVTSVQNKEQTINIKFGKKNTTDGVLGECTTPGAAGSSGNCVLGSYMTHPAFLAFDTNGLWVGKFETGYDGASGPVYAEKNEVNVEKIIVKPNVYSWRGSSLGNMFKNSYDYLRSSDSHMMKNIEWGAMAYLQHSIYGSGVKVRINNNVNFVTGYSAKVEPTVGFNSNVSIEGNVFDTVDPKVDGYNGFNYLNSNSVLSSTTGNYTGVYDTSGGTWEYVMGFNTSAALEGELSAITSLYSDFFTSSVWNKYYDKYTSNSQYKYSNNILGDATGEMGPFEPFIDPDTATRPGSSWYKERSLFAEPNLPWFARSGYWSSGLPAGIFMFDNDTGKPYYHIGYRIVLAPTN